MKMDDISESEPFLLEEVHANPEISLDDPGDSILLNRTLPQEVKFFNSPDGQSLAFTDESFFQSSSSMHGTHTE